jgi:hypothetical protein
MRGPWGQQTKDYYFVCVVLVAFYLFQHKHKHKRVDFVHIKAKQTVNIKMINIGQNGQNGQNIDKLQTPCAGGQTQLFMENKTCFCFLIYGTILKCPKTNKNPKVYGNGPPPN